MKHIESNNTYNLGQKGNPKSIIFRSYFSDAGITRKVLVNGLTFKHFLFLLY